MKAYSPRGEPKKGDSGLPSMSGAIVRFETEAGVRGLALVSEDQALVVRDAASIVRLGQEAIAEKQTLESFARSRVSNAIDFSAVRAISPIDRTNAVRVTLSGAERCASLGSAHDAQPKSLLPVSGGDGAHSDAPSPDNVGEVLVAPGEFIPVGRVSKTLALQPTLASVHLRVRGRAQVQIGYVLAIVLGEPNEGKRAITAIGAELLMGDAPERLTGSLRVKRQGVVVLEQEYQWSAVQIASEIATLHEEDFRQMSFWRPEEVRLHTHPPSVLQQDIELWPQPGDVIEFAAEGFKLGLTTQISFDTAAA